MTNIAVLTTWQSACGIAEYSKNLVQEYLKLGHKVFIFGNRLTDPPDFVLTGSKDAYLFVEKVFGVSWWGEDPTFHASKILSYIPILEKEHGPMDIFHIQYQSSLYEPERFNELVAALVEGNIPVIMTQHDSTINPKHDFFGVEGVIVHNKEIMHSHYISFPTIENTPKVFSFGMGRNDYGFIKMACKEIGVDFEGHDSRKDGWLSEDILFARMSEADAIVLWYNDVNIEGQSAALRTAISSCRPVIVNDIGWFKDAPKFVRKVRTDTISHKAQLQAVLIDILHLVYIRENSYKECAKKHLRIYDEIKKS
jgi:hypothetical protein